MPFPDTASALAQPTNCTIYLPQYLQISILYFTVPSPGYPGSTLHPTRCCFITVISYWIYLDPMVNLWPHQWDISTKDEERSSGPVMVARLTPVLYWFVDAGICSIRRMAYGLIDGEDSAYTPGPMLVSGRQNPIPTTTITTITMSIVQRIPIYSLSGSMQCCSAMCWLRQYSLWLNGGLITGEKRPKGY